MSRRRLQREVLPTLVWMAVQQLTKSSFLFPMRAPPTMERRALGMSERKELPEAWADLRRTFVEGSAREIGWLEQLATRINDSRFVQWLDRKLP
jgi:hypothetical protein